MKIWVVLRYNNIIAVCDLKEKVFDIVWNDLKDYINDGIYNVSEAERILNDFKKKDDSWLYHIEEWETT